MGVTGGAAISTDVIDHGREVKFARIRVSVFEGPDKGECAVFAGDTEVSVGTAHGNDLVVHDSAVSRHHVSIGRAEHGYVVRDLGSTNGTMIDGVRVERAYLAPGAVITIGKTRLRFDLHEGETTTTLSSENKWGPAHGTSDAMRRLFSLLPKLALTDVTVLLEGETGTGKSMLASAIHDASPRASRPFVVLDCGSIPPNLVESELFGHEKGSFTGAIAQRRGAFESAHGGTLFLDEVGELPVDLQPKLLRALEERKIKRVGSNEDIALDVRVIAATNRDLRTEINRGRFRQDLYYRLNTVRLYVPPLRERREDIPMLVANFYRQLSRSGDDPPAELIADLTRHDWPGNVRELRAAVERIVLLGEPAVWRELSEQTSATSGPRYVPGVSFRAAKERAVSDWEREYLREVMTRHDGNVSRAARAVRMDRNYLRELLVRHGLRADDAPA
jgi:DNA-binding NtrC family response regulator